MCGETAVVLARPDLLLGPVLRRVGVDTAVVWVETDVACEVEILGCHASTFHVEGHHYALVHLDGLTPGRKTPYVHSRARITPTVDPPQIPPTGARPQSVSFLSALSAAVRR
jgi:hypothetical protein